MKEKLLNNIRAGQLWKYDCRNSDKNSTVIILKVDNKTSKTIYHVFVNNVLINNELTDILHIPLSREAIGNSLLELIENKVEIPEFIDSYYQWLSNDGGVWDIPLKEVINLTEKTINENKSS